jgi:hypothetical protein
MKARNEPDTLRRDAQPKDQHGLLSLLARSESFRKLFPPAVRRLGGRLLPWEEYQRRLGGVIRSPRDRSGEDMAEPRTDVRLGIIEEFSGFHVDFVEACRDLGVPYSVLDISGPDWLDVVVDSGCDAFLVRPPCLVKLWKDRYDERLRVMVNDLGTTISPSYDELWFYESKRRMHYWLEAHRVPHARAWVFYSLESALEFGRTAVLPIVFKSDFGSKAMGVKIVRTRRELLRLIRRCFKRGFRLPNAHPLEREWGSVFLQEYVPNAREWRGIRIGRSYFAFEKLRRGDFHSGSGTWNLEDPPLSVMGFTRDLTERAGFTGMSIDILETEDGEYLVNELQVVSGSVTEHKTIVNGKPGRYLYDDTEEKWLFEEGTFFQNAGCNLRVEWLLETLERRKG